MAGRSQGARRRPTGPPVGSIATGMVVGQAKRGVLVELGAAELLLPRSKYASATDRIEEMGYGDALTVEVVADPGQPGGAGLSRVGIERSVRQPRPIEGELRRDDAGVLLAPSDGSASIPVVLLDRGAVEVGLLVGTSDQWMVGAPHRDRRFVVLDDG